MTLGPDYGARVNALAPPIPSSLLRLVRSVSRRHQTGGHVGMAADPANRLGETDDKASPGALEEQRAS